MAQIRVCNVSSLFALFLLAALLLGVTGLDLFLRILRLRPVDLATRYVFTVGGAMVMLFGGALFIVSARKISNQASLLDIPKLYVPINQSDLPKTVHRYIQSELSKAASIRSLAKPSDQDRRMNGWGKVGSAQHPVHFRTAACQTMEIVENAAVQFNPALRRDTRLTSRQYIKYLIRNHVVDPSFGTLFCEQYEKIYFAPAEPTESDYLELMKTVSLLIKSIPRISISNPVGFDHDRLFSNITGRSKDILHFECPETASITLTKSISPQLKSSYSIGLPKQRSAGFLFSSLGLNAPFSPNELLERTSRSRPKAEKSDEQRFLLYGRIFEDARLECLYFHKLNRNTMLSLSGLSSWDTDYSQVSTQVVYQTNDASVEASFCSDDYVFGVTGLHKLPVSSWSLGGEVYYTAKERSGGLSCGAQYRDESENDMSVITFAANPMMGHVGSSYTTNVSPHTTMSTSYQFNVYSYDSDVAVGIEYSPSEGHLLKGKFSLKDGIGVKVEGQYRRIVYSLGLMTELKQIPRKAFGIELQIL